MVPGTVEVSREKYEEVLAKAEKCVKLADTLFGADLTTASVEDIALTFMQVRDSGLDSLIQAVNG